MLPRDRERFFVVRAEDDEVNLGSSEELEQFDVNQGFVADEGECVLFGEAP